MFYLFISRSGCARDKNVCRSLIVKSVAFSFRYEPVRRFLLAAPVTRCNKLGRRVPSRRKTMHFSSAGESGAWRCKPSTGGRTEKSPRRAMSRNVQHFTHHSLVASVPGLDANARSSVPLCSAIQWRHTAIARRRGRNPKTIATRRSASAVSQRERICDSAFIKRTKASAERESRVKGGRFEKSEYFCLRSMRS